MNSDTSVLATLIQGACAPDAPRPWVPARKWRVLVVDDDITMQRLERLILVRAGYAVDAAADGEEAWTALLTGQYDLLVTDHDMPRLCGLDLVARMRAARMRLPVIISSGCLDLAKAPEFPHLDLAAVLQKPFGFSELVEVVKQVLPVHPAAAPGTLRDKSSSTVTNPVAQSLDRLLATPPVLAGPRI